MLSSDETRMLTTLGLAVLSIVAISYGYVELGYALAFTAGISTPFKAVCKKITEEVRK